jgi:hypothetical protein
MNEKELLEKQVVKETTESFEIKVENLIWDKDITYLEAITEIVEQEDYDIDSINLLISNNLKMKLEIEAEKLSLLKAKKKNRLDV